MGTFNATERFTRIVWDFTGVADKNGQDLPEDLVEGMLAEPSPEQAAAYLDAYQEVIELGVAHGMQVAERIQQAARGPEALEETPAENVAPELTRRMQAALIAVGVPEQLVNALPHRAIAPFSEWMRSELVGEGDAASSNA